jgi:hypothetical protein
MATRTARALVAATTALVFAWVASSAPRAESAEPITVRLESGRSFTGHVDARSDDQRLWLRFQSADAVIFRPIEWSRVVSGEHEGRTLEPAGLRDIALAFSGQARRTPAGVPLPPPAGGGIEEVPTPRYAQEAFAPPRPASGGSASYADAASAALGMAPPVQSVTFDAHVANWNAGVEVDGLLLHIYPIDGSGRLVAVDAVLDVDLFAPRRRDFNGSPHGRGVVVEPVGRWSKALSADDFTDQGAVVRLPFQAIHPEFDRDTGRFGLVHVRLVAPGHGVFEDSRDAVRIRPFSPLRDHLERNEGGRFLPVESTSRGAR